VNRKEHVLNAALLAIGLGYVRFPAGDAATFGAVAAMFVPVVLGALFPDVDAHYGRHRKALHNLPVLGVFLGYPLYFENLHWVWLGVLTHLLLDVLGSKRGVALFYPLWKREFGFPVGVSVVSRYAGAVTLLVTAVEVLVAYLLLAYLLPALPESAVAALEVLAGSG
jgi:membrane-bound metal-dependent hydrolase YbcI (DUF457 family)